MRQHIFSDTHPMPVIEGPELGQSAPVAAVTPDQTRPRPYDQPLPRTKAPSAAPERVDAADDLARESLTCGSPFDWEPGEFLTRISLTWVDRRAAGPVAVLAAPMPRALRARSATVPAASRNDLDRFGLTLRAGTSLAASGLDVWALVSEPTPAAPSGPRWM